MGLMATGCANSPSEGLSEVGEETVAPEQKTAYTFHQFMCGGGCSLKCTVRDGRLCLIEPNDALGEELGTVCLRGLSEVQHVYSADRIQTPLKRVGARGSNEFEAITWDEALDIIEEKIKGIQQAYGKGAIMWKASGEAASQYPNLANVLECQGPGFSGNDVGAANSYDTSHGSTFALGTYCGFGHGFHTNEYTDTANSKTILAFGSNVFESAVCASTSFHEAREAGADYIVIDPNFSTTAAKASEWVRINPATDGALVMAMDNVVVDEGWYDEEWMLANTSFPFLVDLETNYLARDHEIAEGRTRGVPAGGLVMQGMVNVGVLSAMEGMAEQGVDNPYLVWDPAQNKPVSYLDEGVQPPLEGEFEFEGKKYATVFTLTRQCLASCTPEWAESITSVPADKIVELADKFAHNGPSNMIIGWGGPDKYSNADILGHAAALLVGMTGAIGKPGTGIGNHAGTMSSYRPSFGSWPAPEGAEKPAQTVNVVDVAQENNQEIKGFVAVGDTLQQYFPDRHTLEKWLDGLEFVLFIDMYHTSCAKYADIVLPACTKFECDEEVGGLVVAKNHVQARQKIIDPLFESKTDFWIERAIAERMGFADQMPKSAEELARYQLENASSPYLQGITLEDVQANQGVLPLAGNPVLPLVNFADNKFMTPSGKFEVYFDRKADIGYALPAYAPPSEAYLENPAREKFPIVLYNSRPVERIEGQFFDATWINEHSTPVLELNGVDMQSRSLQDGDIVEVFNDRGSFQIEVLANESIMPGNGRIPQGIWDSLLPAGSINNVMNPYVEDRMRLQGDGPVLAYNDTIVEIKKAGN